jgi:hypothetical protein
MIMTSLVLPVSHGPGSGNFQTPPEFQVLFPDHLGRAQASFVTFWQGSEEQSNLDVTFFADRSEVSE